MTYGMVAEPRRDEAAPRPFWWSVLACPRCRAPLGSPAKCRACGETFACDDATPVLVSADTEREYRGLYSSHGWADARETLGRVLGEPPGADAAPDHLPYHVDRAHAAAIGALFPGKTVLEIGCGGGQCRPWFEELGHRYVGTDISKVRLAKRIQRLTAQEGGGGPDILCDAHFLPFRDQSFDVVYCAAVFEHLACPPLALAEVRRVLRPGGLFCGNASFMEPWHDASFFHLSALGATELLLQCGFEPLHIWPSRGYSGFDALGTMAFNRHLRPASRGLASLSRAIYGVQRTARRLKRRALHRPPSAELMEQCVIAGATDWIARRPAAD